MGLVCISLSVWVLWAMGNIDRGNIWEWYVLCSIFESSNYIFQSVVTTGFMAFANHQTTNTINSFIVIVQLREERLDTVGKKNTIAQRGKKSTYFPPIGGCKIVFIQHSEQG